MNQIPETLLHGPFTRATAKQEGVTSRMLQGKRFVRLYTAVWRHAGHQMTDADWLRAAELALPSDGALTGITRLQQLGFDFGPTSPRHFVVARDLHLVIDGVFLHRTIEMPPLDEVGVTPTAAFVSYCATARVIDAIKVGDWLLHHSHLTQEGLRIFALSQLWRDGAHEALFVVDHLSDRSASLMESETRAVLEWGGLPSPEVNALVGLEDHVTLEFDLYYRAWRTAVEYEGAQHQQDREQYTTDIDRYALCRIHDVQYLQVTKERLRSPRRLVGEVHRALVRRGYDGPAPDFGERWQMLFRRISDALGSRRDRILAARGRGAVS